MANRGLVGSYGALDVTRFVEAIQTVQVKVGVEKDAHVCVRNLHCTARIRLGSSRRASVAIKHLLRMRSHLC